MLGKKNNFLDNIDFPIAYRTISEVAAIIGVPQYVLRFWESKFSNVIKPEKYNNRRNYSAEDISMLQKIKILLYDEGYTIKGVQNLFNFQDLDKKMNNIAEAKPKKPNLKTMVLEASSEILKNHNNLSADKIKLSAILVKLQSLQAKMAHTLAQATMPQ
jgi:DNA-binding transcriptional MerR regulator